MKGKPGTVTSWPTRGRDVLLRALLCALVFAWGGGVYSFPPTDDDDDGGGNSAPVAFTSTILTAKSGAAAGEESGQLPLRSKTAGGVCAMSVLADAAPGPTFSRESSHALGRSALCQRNC